MAPGGSQAIIITGEGFARSEKSSHKPNEYLYRQTSNIRHTLVGNKIVIHSDIVGALLKGLITVGKELRQQHLSDLLSGAGTPLELRSRDVPAGQQITRVLLP